MGNIFSFSCSCGDALLSRCLDCSIRKAAYINKLEDNLAALSAELKKLIEARDDVNTRLATAEQQRKQPTHEVQGWLARVQAVQDKVTELEQLTSQEIEKLCLGGYCSKNCKSSYDFGKRVAETLKELTDLKAEGLFPEVAQDIPQDAVDEIPMDPNIVGQQSMFDEVWRCLKEEEVGIVGLYGPGGVGKTTLLKQINNKFCNEGHHFDVVIWAVVSKDHKLEKVQEDIGKKIGLCEDSWSGKNLEQKTLDIFNILKKKRFVLLLDDIWERVDLISLGVPRSTASKVVFTTRSSYVCGQMEVHREFKVRHLEEEEAWNLFEKRVGSDTLNSHPQIRELAKTVAEECRGLPLALNTVGRSMARRKTFEEWEDAVEVLRKLAFEFRGMEEEVYSILKFSYDNLPSQKLKSCFLYCCLFPEDYRIDKKHLIECWLAEGLLDEHNGINRGYTVIGNLVLDCLLEECDDYVVMHDVLRDMALWIACDKEKEKENFLVQVSLGIKKAPEIEKWEGVKRISLMENQIDELLYSPRCHNLQTLFLERNELRTICSEFFQFMPSLRVLNLSENHDLRELPPEISNLISLEHLDLSFTGLVKLPEEIKKLVKLKYLSVGATFSLRLFPRQILSNLLMLRTLIINRYGSGRNQEEDSILFYDCEPLIQELLGLEHLNKLTISLQNARAIQNFSSSPVVENCYVSLFIEYIEDSESLNILSLGNVKHLDLLGIYYCDFNELKIDYVDSLQQLHGFNSLISVVVFQCDNLKDLTWLVLAPNLKRINVCYCDEMEEIINVEKFVKIQEILGKDHQIIPFENLECFRLQGLSNLKSIYCSALPFECLKKIIVRGCPKLQKLPLDSNSAKEGKIVIGGNEYWWSNLQWENEQTQKKFDSCWNDRLFS